VHLTLLRVLHGRHGQAVPLPREQVPHCVGHELPVGHVAALHALSGGDIDDVPLHGASGRLLPRHGHRGGSDTGGGEVFGGERPCGRQEVGRKGVSAGVLERRPPYLLAHHLISVPGPQLAWPCPSQPSARLQPCNALGGHAQRCVLAKAGRASLHPATWGWP